MVRDDIAPSNQTTGDPFEVSYRMAGRSLGYTGNNGSLDMDYAASIGQRFVNPSGNNFRFNHAQAAADFSQGIDPINSFYQGSAAGSYEVRAGDTLGAIAAGLWGDAGLWWKLAEANGLSGQGGLVVGQRLTIPAGVMRATQSAGTFNPYDPADAMGATSPGGGPRPAPSKHGGCGVIGTIIMVIVAIVVTIDTAGAASGAIAAMMGTAGAGTTVLGGAAMGIAAIGSAGGLAAAGFGTTALVIGGAVGSMASQWAGVAMGVQDKFSWNAVALSAISGALGGGGKLGVGGKGAWSAALRGAEANIITQGGAVS